MNVSIVIPTRNRPARLSRVLAALAPQVRERTGCRAEVIVVDDASDTGAREQVARSVAQYADAHMRAIFMPLAGGPSVARNAGIALATGDIIGLLDDDCVPGPGYVDVTLRVHADHPEALLINGKLEATRGDIFTRFWRYYYDRAFNRDSGPFYEVDHVSSGHCSIKRPLLRLTHPLFDEGLPSREDYDLRLRLHDAGVPVYKADEVEAVIDCRSTLRAFMHQRIWYQQGEAGIRHKYGIARIREEQRRRHTRPSLRFWRLYLVSRFCRRFPDLAARIC